MNRVHLKFIFAVLALLGPAATATPTSLAGDNPVSCSDDCSNYWSNCGVGRCCDRCYTVGDQVCQFRIIDGCTKCAWSRTWHAPNALANPLREYYVPRPPQCCWCIGCAGRYGHGAGPTWETPVDTNCQNHTCLASSAISPEAAAGFSPAQFERLGRIRNELDVVGPAGSPASGRAAAPAR